MIGKTIIELDRVDSTNTYARDLLAKGEIEEGLVVMASEQYAGKGQNRNTWQSEPGKNLTFSVILHPSFLEPAQQFRLNKAVSLAIAGFMSSLVSDVSIKWPNDICVGTKKIAGILIEHNISGSRLESSVAGFGININQTRYAREIPNPVSLIQVLLREMALKEALESVCRFLDDRYSQLKNGKFALLDADYNTFLMGSGEWRSFRKEELIFEGKIEGVDDFGRLLLRTREDELLTFNHKEIEYIL
jgi:BirA family biotin operon repressor/biotin-[acetyl-CoA-carboxylase] ligase